MNNADETKIAQIYVRIAEMLQEKLGFSVRCDNDYDWIVFNEGKSDFDNDGRFLWLDGGEFSNKYEKLEELFWTCGSYITGALAFSELKYDASDEEILNFVKKTFAEDPHIICGTP